jgi:hypothetical protein
MQRLYYVRNIASLLGGGFLLFPNKYGILLCIRKVIEFISSANHVFSRFSVWPLLVGRSEIFFSISHIPSCGSAILAKEPMAMALIY